MSASILTNNSAMAALQTLQSISEQLDTTQNQISSGLRVGSASDNAAYWSIATTMKSDKSSMSSISDALGIGASVADAAYTGLNSAVTILGQIKDKLTTATSDGVDKTKVQADVKQLQDQLQTIADSSSFSGQNWLEGDTSTTKQIVSSLGRDSSGSITVGTIQFSDDVRLFGSSSGTSGILDSDINVAGYSTAGTNTATVDSADTAATSPAAVQFATADDKISFSISQNGAAAQTVQITQSTLEEAGLTDHTIQSYADLGKALNQALSDANISGVTASVSSSGAVSFNSSQSLTVSSATDTGTDTISVKALGLNDATDGDITSTASSSAVTVTGGVMGITLTSSSTSDEVQNYIKAVDQALSSVTTAASNVGSVQTRISTQTDFINSLMDTIDTGVGTLVDADMNQASTKLKALQTQQQLGIQALSIANSNSQNILSLFR